jgi:acetyl esterase/lipase
MRSMPRRFALGLALLVSVAAVGCKPPAPPAGPCATPGLPTTVAYRTIPGVARNATSLDVYAPAPACNAPVVLWVHGGGYHTGDKANQVANKISLFNGKGWVFVSINYRLTVAGDPTSAHFPDHYDDVAAAVRWVHTNIASYGGDKARVALLGHSAGADIVSNVADNPTYLRAYGLGLDAVRCAGPFDTEGFDKVAASADEEQFQWLDALGNNPNYLTETSAIYLAKRGTGIPRTIGVYRGTAQRQEIEKRYLATLNGVGVQTVTIDARSLTHGEVNTRIGAPGDTVMTPPLVAFLTSCFA